MLVQKWQRYLIEILSDTPDTGKDRFDEAIVSLFWTAAGMGLPDSVDFRYEDQRFNYGVVFFFASFILVLNWTLLQASLLQVAN